MALIASSILASDFTNLAQQIRMTEIGGTDWIHCDIMDGHFVPNLTFGPLIVNAARRSTKLPLDVHLMIENADKYLEDFANAGADRLTVHQEAVVHLNRTIHKIKELGMKAGVALNPSTPVKTLEYVAEFVDLILIMSVNPGFGGQIFIENSIEKIKEAAELRKKLKADYLIEIDGGIDTQTIKKAFNAGCDVFVSGSSIFKADNISAAVVELKNMIK